MGINLAVQDAVRSDRWPRSVILDSNRLKVSFGPVAVHYQVGIDVCPSRYAWRKGAVEKAHT